MQRWMKRAGMGIAGLLFLLALCAAMAEHHARRRAALEYPAPGRLVDVGDRRIQIDCRGSGSPTVVFESGLDTLGALSWTEVGDSVATTTRTCTYSRAGLVWSDPSGGPFDVKAMAHDLHAALRASAEHPPYVMVGHSMGGPYSLVFTGLYPREVAGLVLVDASHPDQVERLRDVGIKIDETNPSPMLKAIAALAWSGLPRMIPALRIGSNRPIHVQRVGNAYLATSFAAVLRELEGANAALATSGNYRNLGDRPLMVLTAGKALSDDTLKALKLTRADANRLGVVWRQLHDEETAWSRRGRQIVVPDASHYIQFDRPDVVIAAVREVVGDVRELPATPAARPSPPGRNAAPGPAGQTGSAGSTTASRPAPPPPLAPQFPGRVD